MSNRLRSLSYGNGLSYWRDRDAGGRLSGIRLVNADQTALYQNQVRYDTRNRVSGYGDINFGYDDLDHLSLQTNSKNQQRTTLSHDNNGNLMRLENTDAQGRTTRTDSLTYRDNRLANETITPAPPADGTGGWNAPYVYDLSGFVIGHGGYGFGYNASREMASFETAQGREDYRYDGARRRVLKTNGQVQTRYVYDNADHLIYEQTGRGKPRNTVWLGDIPLAVIDQNTDGTLSAVYYIETDFTNTPRYLRNATGDLVKPVWSRPIAPYGDTPALEDPDGDGTKVTFNLRYPGQYFDSYSGLHYNYTRYFQPRTGRYLQPDLIGLEGGTNVYTYAGGNPVGYTDPTGTEAENSVSSSIGGFLDNALASFESTRFAADLADMTALAQEAYGLPGIQMSFMPVLLPLGVEERIAGGIAKRLVDPKSIRFTQDSISMTFKDGRSVRSLIDDLKSGKVSLNNLPPIRTFQQDGLTFTLDNRRLFAADQAGVKVPTIPATAEELAKELPRKFSTPNQGCIICLRGTAE